MDRFHDAVQKVAPALAINNRQNTHNNEVAISVEPSNEVTISVDPLNEDLKKRYAMPQGVIHTNNKIQKSVQGLQNSNPKAHIV